MQYQLNTVICIGTGDASADILAQQIAQARELEYQGVLDRHSQIETGCWHTSIYDIRLPELKDKLVGIDNVSILVLDQGRDQYSRDKEYNSTVDMAQALSDVFPVEFVNAEMSNTFRQLLKVNKSFCILPFMSINVAGTKLKHCCWQHPFDHEDSGDFYSNKNSLFMREQMLHGNKVSQCERCYKIEDVEAMSPRQEYTLRWAYQLGLKSYQDVTDNTELVSYEITLGNKCNAMCRMCNPMASRLIDREYFQLGLTSQEIGDTEPNYFDQINLDTIQRLHVSGGESTISENLESFLEKCIQHNRTDFEIFVSTNAYAITNRFINLVKNFKNLNISISIDGYQDLNYYIRWPIKWDKFSSNVERITSILGPERYAFNTVASIYNISQLYELYKYLDETYPTAPCSITFLTDPKHLVPWNFPNKQVALDNLNLIKQLNIYQRDESFRSKIDGLINKISQCQIDYNMLKEFFVFNDKLDQARNVKLEDFLPKLSASR